MKRISGGNNGGRRAALAAALAVAALFVCVPSARADPIGGPTNLNCLAGTCQGSWYELLYEPWDDLDGNASTDTYRVTYRIDTSTYTGDGTAIDTVAVKISDVILVGFVNGDPERPLSFLYDAPGDNLSDWQVRFNGLNANGCSNGGSGWICADEITVAGVNPITAPVRGENPVLEWVFIETIARGTLFDDAFEASIKARYVDAADRKVGALVSEQITLQRVPEPIPFEMIIGLLGVALILCKRPSALPYS